MVATPLSAIGLGTLSPGAQLINHQNVEETWKGEIYTYAGSTIAYVKMLRPNQVISEVVCALLGLAVGLKIPKPYLVRVDSNNLPDSKKWERGEITRICFGSEDAKHPSFRRLVNPQNPQSLAEFMRVLLSWKGYRPTALFDEWIANCDRNSGNLLYDGDEIWLIDHAHALTGPNWTRETLKPDAVVGNRFLQDEFVQSLPLDEKNKWATAATQVSLQYQALAFDTLVERGMLEDCATTDQINAVLNFVTTRATNFVALACNRLGIPALLT
jgi:hypothetical protein